MYEWDLTAIRSKVRSITGYLSTGQMADATVDGHINQAYQNELPRLLGHTQFHSWFTFDTVASTGDYDIDALASDDGANIIASVQFEAPQSFDDHLLLHPMIPFGGVKGSGYGLEFGGEGLNAAARLFGHPDGAAIQRAGHGLDGNAQLRGDVTQADGATPHETSSPPCPGCFAGLTFT